MTGSGAVGFSTNALIRSVKRKSHKQTIGMKGVLKLLNLRLSDANHHKDAHRNTTNIAQGVKHEVSIRT